MGRPTFCTPTYTGQILHGDNLGDKFFMEFMMHPTRGVGFQHPQFRGWILHILPHPLTRVIKFGTITDHKEKQVFRGRTCPNLKDLWAFWATLLRTPHSIIERPTFSIVIALGR